VNTYSVKSQWVMKCPRCNQYMDKPTLGHQWHCKACDWRRK